MKQKIRKIIAKVLSFVLVMSFCLGTDLGVMTAYATDYSQKEWYITTDENGVLQKVQFKFTTNDTAPGTWYFYLWDKNDTSGENGRPAILAQTSVTTSDGEHEITLEYQGEKGKEYLVGTVLKNSSYSKLNTGSAEYSKWPYLTAVCDMMDCDKDALAGSVYVNGEPVSGSVSDALKTEIQTYNITIDSTNLAEGALLAAVKLDSDGNDMDEPIELTNGSTVEIPKDGGLLVMSNSSNFKVTVSDTTLAKVGDLMVGQAESGYYISEIKGNITVVVESTTPTTDSCTVTIDSTNLAEGALLAALRFDSDGYEMGEPIELTNGSTVEIPKDGGLLVMSNSSNFKVTVSDAALAKVGDLMVGQAESGYYISEIKGNITVVVESTTPPAGETVAVTLDKSNFSGELYYCINEAASFEPVVENTINITTNDFLSLASFGVEYEVTASDNGVSIDKIPDDAGACIYKISGFTNATTIIVNDATTQEPEGGTASFSVNVVFEDNIITKGCDKLLVAYVENNTNGSSPKTYEWHKYDGNENPVVDDGGNADEFHVKDYVTVGDNYFYCEVTIGNEKVKSNTVRVHVLDEAGFGTATVTETTGNAEGFEDLISLLSAETLDIEEFYNWELYDFSNLFNVTIKDKDNCTELEFDNNYFRTYYLGAREKGTTNTWTEVWNESHLPELSDSSKEYEYAVVYITHCLDGYLFANRNEVVDASAINYESDKLEIDSIWYPSNTDGLHVAFVPKDEAGGTQEVTYDITLDRTNYAEGYVDLYTYDSEGSNVANTQENNAAIAMPEGGKVRVFADSEFTVTAEGATVSEMLSAGEEGYYYELTGITADTTVVVNKVTTQEQTYELTIDCEGFTEDAPLAVIRFDSDGYDIDAIEVANGDKVEIPVGGSVIVASTTPNFKVAVENNLADVSDLQQGAAECGYVITNIQGDITIVIESITQGGDPTYNITLDRTNYAEGYVDLYTYDSEGNNVANTQENNAAIAMPEGGKVRVFADSEFTVAAEGATISEMLSAGEEGYYYELTGIAADTTVVVSPSQSEPVITAPIITIQPENKTAEDGNTTTFSITATGENLTYQWKIDRNDGNGFVNLNGATSASYTTSTVDMDCDGFKYQCIVSNEGGSVTSDIATLTVTEKPSVHTHSLTQVPAKAATCTEEGNMVYYTCSGCDNLFADANGTTTTTAEAVKIAALEHDWTGEWTVVKEATATEEGKKETLCTRGCGEKKEEVIPATGVEAVDAPVITIQPENKTAEDGNTTTFSITATGENLTYQWKIDRNDGNGFVNLNGATSASYTTSTVDMDCDGFKYQCIVSNEGGSVTSDIATLTVTEKPSVHTHSLTQVPAKAATCTEEGNTVYYTCSGCDSLFTDANGTTTITAEAIKVAALEHDWTGEWTVIKEATATEEGKKETLCTNGCGQKKVVVIPATGTTDDNDNLEKDAEVEPEAPIDEVTLNNSKEELLDAGNIFTDAEKTQIEDGADARIWLEIGKTDEGAIASTDKAKIEEEASRIMGENPEITYFDADLFKQVGSGAKQEISEPGIPMKITITIPGKLINRDKNILREFKIIRLHDGKVEIISGTFNAATGEFTFESDKFSTYAIIYKDVPVDDNTNTTPGNNDNNNPTQGSNGGQTSGDANVSKPADDKKDEVPKTGYNTGTGYAFMLMLLSGLGIVISSRKKKIWNKEA